MTAETGQTLSVLRLLIGSFITSPGHFTLTPEETDEAVIWLCKVHGDDYGKVCGREGAHLRALHIIMRAISRVSGRRNAFILAEPQKNQRTETKRPQPAAAYDPKSAQHLLDLILSEIGVGQWAIDTNRSVTLDGWIRYTFAITLHDKEDYAALLAREPDADMTLIGAIGTLFRARGNNEGVRFQLDVVKP